MIAPAAAPLPGHALAGHALAGHALAENPSADLAPVGVPPDLRARRWLDLVVAGSALILLAPLLLLIVVAIAWESPGPVLFRQVRLGRGGRPFTLYKFRKFHADAGSTGSALTLAGDPRMTATGRFLMATKLDELPQLWNVLRGDMAVIGPRPESLAFADCFAAGFESLLVDKPGLLGPCQILFRNESALFAAAGEAEDFYRRVLFPAKARVDLAYAGRRTLVSDLALLGWGILAVCGGGGDPAKALARLLAGPVEPGWAGLGGAIDSAPPGP